MSHILAMPPRCESGNQRGKGRPSDPTFEDMVACAADTEVTVLLQGESGVGKGATAALIHQRSSRRSAPFVKVNCAALPEPLLESELFGYERGAFTGADRRKMGQFEVASSGTLFLDEIGELSLGLQAKLLHVLQDGAFVPLGRTRENLPDVRVIVSTNQDLDELVAKKLFREDLFFRLNVLTLRVPPLRERTGEILPLAEQFLTAFCQEYRRSALALTSQTRKTFLAYPWPGNIRELENTVRRIVLLGNQESVMDDLVSNQRKRAALRNGPLDLTEDEEGGLALGLKEIGKRAARVAEREAMCQILAKTGWNRWRAAQILKVSYKALLYKMQDCGLDPKSGKAVQEKTDDSVGALGAKQRDQGRFRGKSIAKGYIQDGERI